MAETKYEKYVLRKPLVRKEDGKLGVIEEIQMEGLADTGPLVWCSPELKEKPEILVESGIISGDISVLTGTRPGVFKPHKHDDHGEIFCFIGTNPNDPTDLGAEAEFCLGEGEEQEKILINTSSRVYVPPGVTHFPLTWKNVKRPVIFFVVSHRGI
jgi:hypothetical protein